MADRCGREARAGACACEVCVAGQVGRGWGGWARAHGTPVVELRVPQRSVRRWRVRPRRGRGTPAMHAAASVRIRCPPHFPGCPPHSPMRPGPAGLTSMISLALSSSPTTSLIASIFSSFSVDLSLISSASCSGAGRGAAWHVPAYQQAQQPCSELTKLKKRARGSSGRDLAAWARCAARRRAAGPGAGQQGVGLRGEARGDRRAPQLPARAGRPAGVSRRHAGLSGSGARGRKA